MEPVAIAAPPATHTFTAGPIKIPEAHQDSTVRFTCIPLEKGGGRVDLSASDLSETGRAKSVAAMGPRGIEILAATHNAPHGLPLAVTVHARTEEGDAMPVDSQSRHVIHMSEHSQQCHTVALPIGSGVPHEVATHIFCSITDEQHAENVAVDGWPDGEVGGVGADGKLSDHSHAVDVGEGLVSFPADAPTKVAHVVRINDGNALFLGGKGVKKVNPPDGKPLLVMTKEDLRSVTDIVESKLARKNPLSNGITFMAHHNPANDRRVAAAAAAGAGAQPQPMAWVKWRLAVAKTPEGVPSGTTVSQSALSAMLGGGGGARAGDAQAYSQMTDADRNAEIRKLASKV